MSKPIYGRRIWVDSSFTNFADVGVSNSEDRYFVFMTNLTRLAIGDNNVTNLGSNSIAIGIGAKGDADDSIALGRLSEVTGNNSGIVNTSGASKTNNVANTFAFFTGSGSNPGFKIASEFPEIPEFTVATLPSATIISTGFTGLICVTDESGGRTLATSDGTNWRRVADGAVVS